MTSPASSGKSSLLKLYENSLKGTNVLVVWIYCETTKTGTQLLLEAGIDLYKNWVKEEFNVKDRFTIVFIDDAQAKFEDVDFWANLIKYSPNWLPSTIRFVISSTHLLSGGGPSPFAFQALPKLERSDFLLSPRESNEFLEMPDIGLPPNSIGAMTLKHVIVRECGGLIGALRQSVDSIGNRYSKDVRPSEEDLLQYFLSVQVLSFLDRCFGETHSIPMGYNFKLFLKTLNFF